MHKQGITTNSKIPGLFIELKKKYLVIVLKMF